MKEDQFCRLFRMLSYEGTIQMARRTLRTVSVTRREIPRKMWKKCQERGCEVFKSMASPSNIEIIKLMILPRRARFY